MHNFVDVYCTKFLMMSQKDSHLSYNFSIVFYTIVRKVIYDEVPTHAVHFLHNFAISSVRFQ